MPRPVIDLTAPDAPKAKPGRYPATLTQSFYDRDADGNKTGLWRFRVETDFADYLSGTFATRYACRTAMRDFCRIGGRSFKAVEYAAPRPNTFTNPPGSINIFDRLMGRA